MTKTVSPTDLASSIWRRLRREVRKHGNSTLTEQNLKKVWMDTLADATPPIDPQYAQWQWLHLSKSIKRIEAQQQLLRDAGNITRGQMKYRVDQRVNVSVRESARRVVIEQLQHNEMMHDGTTMARMLHTAAAEPDLAHMMLEGKVMPLSEVLQEMMRFGCQHEYEIVALKPIGARMGKGYGFEGGLEDDIPPVLERA